METVQKDQMANTITEAELVKLSFLLKLIQRAFPKEDWKFKASCKRIQEVINNRHQLNLFYER